MSKKNIGSSFDDFLEEESLLEFSTAVALKRVIAWQIDQEMNAQKVQCPIMESNFELFRFESRLCRRSFGVKI
jgi:hypothetical protein